MLLAVLLAGFGSVAWRAEATDLGSQVPVSHPVEGSSNPADLDLAELVPAAGRLDYVWYVPAGRGRPQVAVAWHFRDARAVIGWSDRRRYVLTLWSPEEVTPGSARWVPHVLIRASPFPLVGKSVRLADVTGDGHDDLLVTAVCSDCNHGTAAASIYATLGHQVRKIYGVGYIGVAKGRGRQLGVRGRVISETAWGAQRGLIWFDEPRGGTSVCCPAYRLQTFMRWTSRGWKTVRTRRSSPTSDPLLAHGYPAI